MGADWKYDYVMNGMVRDFDGSPIYEYFANDTPSRHLTIVFNVFVLLQIFNMISSRKINDELNIFKDVTTNPMFMGVWLSICVLHFIIKFVDDRVAFTMGDEDPLDVEAAANDYEELRKKAYDIGDQFKQV